MTAAHVLRGSPIGSVVGEYTLAGGTAGHIWWILSAALLISDFFGIAFDMAAVPFEAPPAPVSRTEITTPEVLDDESVVELSLRPQRLAEFIGQEKVKDSLRIYIDAAGASEIARRGRMATSQAYRHFGFAVPVQQGTFL